MRRIALTGGLGYLVIFFTGIFANFYVLEEYKVAGDASATFQNFASNSSMLIWAIVAFVAMVVFDLVLTWVLYVLFRQTDEKLSKITAVLRLINAMFFAVALIQLVDVLELVVTPNPSQFASLQVMEALEQFNNIWLVGLVFFGIHLTLLSKLLKLSNQVHKAVPALLFIAGVGYVIDSILQFTYSGYAEISELSTMVVVLPGLIGELSLTGWLLVKAGRSSNSQSKLCITA